MLGTMGGTRATPSGSHCTPSRSTWTGRGTCPGHCSTCRENLKNMILHGYWTAENVLDFRLGLHPAHVTCKRQVHGCSCCNNVEMCCELSLCRTPMYASFRAICTLSSPERGGAWMHFCKQFDQPAAFRPMTARRYSSLTVSSMTPMISLVSGFVTVWMIQKDDCDRRTDRQTSRTLIIYRTSCVSCPAQSRSPDAVCD